MDERSADSIGRRIRDVRTWRGATLRATAELAGISPAYLSMIETGERPLQRRSLLEAVARALRVAPSELGAAPTTGASDPDVTAALDGLVLVEAALNEVQFGEQTVSPRPWEAVSVEVEHLCEVLRPQSDIRAQMDLLPGLIRELNALAVTHATRQVLEALADTLQCAAMAAKNLGARGIPGLAALRLREVAEELDEPHWIGLARFARVQTLGSGSRPRARELSLQAADDLQAHLDDDSSRQLYGVLHLNAALAAAALVDGDSAAIHLNEARKIAETAEDPSGVGFGNLSFNRTNVRIWEVAVALELGEPGRVPELAGRIQPESMTSWSRQGAYYIDLGRALAVDRSTRDASVSALVRAEAVAPVRTRANIWARETVRDLLPRVKRDSTPGRELRGLAYRMGMAA